MRREAESWPLVSVSGAALLKSSPALYYWTVTFRYRSSYISKPWQALARASPPHPPGLPSKSHLSEWVFPKSGSPVVQLVQIPRCDPQVPAPTTHRKQRIRWPSRIRERLTRNGMKSRSLLWMALVMTKGLNGLKRFNYSRYASVHRLSYFDQTECCDCVQLIVPVAPKTEKPPWPLFDTATGSRCFFSC